MGNFNRDRGNDRGGNRGGGFGGGYNRRDSERPEMYKATCAECGKPCEVPFRPSGDKPVYCRECFNMRGDRDGGNDRNDRGNSRSNYGEKQMFSATCDSCGKRCEVPFRPSGGKPVYCSECFGQKEDDRDNRKPPFNVAPKPPGLNPELAEQLKTVNEKLDRLLRALELRGKMETPKEIVAKAVIAKKPVTVAKPKAATKTKAKAKAKKTTKKN